MDYDTIVGGVGEIGVEVIIHGGSEMIIGGSAKSEGRNKIIHLKHVPNDTKKLLAIIHMARPVVFGNLQYNNGKTGNIRAGPMMGEPEAALLESLRTRLNRSAENVVKALAHEYKLVEPMYWAFTDLIQLLLRYIKNKRPNMRSIKVDGDIGGILDRVRNGDTFFKIATDHKDWPVNIVGVVQELLEVLRRERTPNGVWNEPKHNAVAWPELSPDNKKAMDDIANKKYKTIRNFVEAIVTREHVLINHMDAVEMYYVNTAKEIKKYTTALSIFLKPHQQPLSKSMVVNTRTITAAVSSKPQNKKEDDRPVDTDSIDQLSNNMVVKKIPNSFIASRRNVVPNNRLYTI
jgi:hypothetical protein